MTKNFTVLATGKIDGTAYRLIELADGSARLENWGPKGWTLGGATLSEIFDSPPISAKFAAELGIPKSDLGSS
jgi:hypothetical protein